MRSLLHNVSFVNWSFGGLLIKLDDLKVVRSRYAECDVTRMVGS